MRFRARTKLNPFSYLPFFPHLVYSTHQLKSFWSLPVGGQFISPGTLRDIKIVVFADKRTISITNDPGDAEENIAKFTNQLLRLSEEYGVAIPQEITIPSPVYFDHSVSFAFAFGAFAGLA